MLVGRINFSNVPFGMPKRDAWAEGRHAEARSGAWAASSDVVTNTEMDKAKLDKAHERLFSCRVPGYGDSRELEREGAHQRFEKQRESELRDAISGARQNIRAKLNAIESGMTRGQRAVGLFDDTKDFLKSESEYVDHVADMNGMRD